MTGYRWVGVHDYNDHANDRVVEPGEALPDDISDRVAESHPYDVESIEDDASEGEETETGDGFGLDTFLGQTASEQVDAIESGGVDDHLSAIQDGNEAENEFTTVEEAVEQRLDELRG